MKWLANAMFALVGASIDYSAVDAIEAGRIHAKFQWVYRADNPGFFWLLIGMLLLLSLAPLTLAAIGTRAALRGPGEESS